MRWPPDRCALHSGLDTCIWGILTKELARDDTLQFSGKTRSDRVLARVETIDDGSRGVDPRYHD